MREPIITLEGHMVECDLVIPLYNPGQIDLVRRTLEEHGRQRRISYRNTGCGFEGGFYWDAQGAYLQGATGKPQILSCKENGPFSMLDHSIIFDGSLGQRVRKIILEGLTDDGSGHLTIFNYQQLRPEIQQSIWEILREGGIEVNML